MTVNVNVSLFDHVVCPCWRLEAPPNWRASQLFILSVFFRMRVYPERETLVWMGILNILSSSLTVYQ